MTKKKKRSVCVCMCVCVMLMLNLTFNIRQVFLTTQQFSNFKENLCSVANPLDFGELSWSAQDMRFAGSQFCCFCLSFGAFIVHCALFVVIFYFFFLLFLFAVVCSCFCCILLLLYDAVLLTPVAISFFSDIAFHDNSFKIPSCSTTSGSHNEDAQRRAVVDISSAAHDLVHRRHVFLLQGHRARMGLQFSRWTSHL